MRDTFAQNFYHFVWTTKRRQPIILPEFELLMDDCIRRRCAEKRIICHAVNGLADHRHLVCEIPPSLSCADAMQHVKGGSSSFINSRRENWKLQWQRGYAVLTFSRKELDAVVRYVDEQKERHYGNNLWPALERINTEDD